MISDDKILKIKELSTLEKVLKERRDFEDLVKFYDVSLYLFDSHRIQKIMLPQMAYCLARLGRKSEAQKAMDEFKDLYTYVDYDLLNPYYTVASFFLSIDASVITQNIIDKVKSWLFDSDYSKYVVQIVFDYADFISSADNFDKSYLQSKHYKYSDELLYCIFTTMCVLSHSKVYYNRKTNDVQQLVEGYLSSHMAANQEFENRHLASRIMNCDNHDSIIDGTHFLIPRLSLYDFLNKFSDLSLDYVELLYFVAEFESLLMDEYGDDVDFSDQIFITNSLFEKFSDNIYQLENRGILNYDFIMKIASKTGKEIALDFLNEING